MNLLPLERILEKQSLKRDSFPRMELDYASQYRGLLNHLRSNLYKDIDAGLAANSEEHGFYTAHNAEHFDEVVRYAGKLLGVENGDEETKLSPYEIYVLLVAIRIHDVGNIHGREKHEKRCFPILRNCGAAAGDDDTEKKKIAQIAQAHGGKTNSGSKDTISELPDEELIGSGKIRSRLLAAVVRFADEICESRCRAANYLLQHGSVPKYSEIFHQYAASISANNVSVSDKRVVLKYVVKAESVSKQWGCATQGPKTENYLIDEILERLEKIDKERRYCNRFSKDIYTIDSIRATIEIVDENHDVILTIPVPELCDSGYPDDGPSKLKDTLKQYCGEECSKMIAIAQGVTS